MALPLGLDADEQLCLPGRVHAQHHSVRHPHAQDVHVPARSGPHRLGEEGDPDPHHLAPLTLLRLLTAKLFVSAISSA
jgi:hypothetical protein